MVVANSSEGKLFLKVDLAEPEKGDLIFQSLNFIIQRNKKLF